MDRDTAVAMVRSARLHEGDTPVWATRNPRFTSANSCSHFLFSVGVEVQARAKSEHLFPPGNDIAHEN